MRTTVSVTTGSPPQVIRAQSRAIASAFASGSQAKRPKAYQLAWSNCDPDQLRSLPILATPAMPVAAPASTGVSITLATVVPLAGRKVSASSTSSHIVPR